VAVSRTEDFVDGNGTGNMALALTEGFQSGFLACVVLAGVGLVLSLALLGPRRGDVTEPLEPQPAAAGD
jgi:hypothetical protein